MILANPVVESPVTTDLTGIPGGAREPWGSNGILTCRMSCDTLQSLRPASSLQTRAPRLNGKNAKVSGQPLPQLIVQSYDDDKS